MPRVSVVLPARKPNARYFTAAVQSILGQTLSDIELIVVEDSGEQAAAEILHELGDRRLRHVVNEQPGISAALNRGVAESRSELVARMDADDIAVPHRLEAQVAAFEREAALAVIGSQSTIIDAENRVIGVRRYPTEPDEIVGMLMRYNCLCHPSVMFRRDVVLDAGGYAGGLNEDYDLWCRLAAGGALLRNDAQALILYRFHADALKRQNVAGIIRRGIEIKQRYFAGRMDATARLRLLAERFLTHMPEPVVVELFRRITYSRVDV